MIHVVAIAGLAGSAVAAAVVGDDSIAVIEKEQHLRVPVIGRQRPTMAEHDRLTLAPVLVIDFDPILGLDCRHFKFSFLNNRTFHNLRPRLKRPPATTLASPERLSTRCDALMAIGRNSRAPPKSDGACRPGLIGSGSTQNLLWRTVIRPRIRSEGMFVVPPVDDGTPGLSGVA